MERLLSEARVLKSFNVNIDIRNSKMCRYRVSVSCIAFSISMYYRQRLVAATIRKPPQYERLVGKIGTTKSAELLCFLLLVKVVRQRNIFIF